ncbi:MAG: hypothetical protein ACOY94_06095 [Bacillota bacterium]
MQDYLMVRGVALALAALAFFVGVARMGATDLPHERSRAQDLVIKAALAFVILVGDRMIAQGLVTWFEFPTSYLPVFWQ